MEDKHNIRVILEGILKRKHETKDTTKHKSNDAIENMIRIVNSNNPDRKITVSTLEDDTD